MPNSPCKHAIDSEKPGGVRCSVGAFKGSLSPSVCLTVGTCKSYDGPDRNAYLNPTISTPKSRGLGDTIAKITSAVGITPCGGCKERAELLNKMFPYKEPEP